MPVAGMSDEFHHAGSFLVRYLIEAALPFPRLLPHVNLAEFLAEGFADQGIGLEGVECLDQRARQPLRERFRRPRPAFDERIEVLVPGRARIELFADAVFAGGKR